MKVLICGEKETIIRMDTADFARLIGKRVGDGYHDDISFSKILEIEWNLDGILESLRQLQILHEARERLVAGFVELTKTI